ncbi:MAG: hypothetical protein JXA92_01040 [candidate division Zixibacteria bacterium]|nr:hypothetical protein [candidate division Zixibacteria bacterium]
MKVIILFIAMMIFTVFGTVAADKALYLQIRMLDENHENIFSDDVTGGCFVKPGESCEGIYLSKSDGNTYTAFGDINHNQHDVTFELIYSLTLFEEEDAFRVNASVYTINYEPGTSKIISGGKEAFNREIDLDRKYIFGKSRLPGGEEVFLELRAIGDRAPVSVFNGPACNLELKTTFLHEGRVYGSHISTQMFQNEPNVIPARFMLPREDDSDPEHLRYTVKIGFSEELKNITRPMECEITFHRMYMIDTLGNPEDNEFDIGYFSSFVKEIELRPGKELKLIFPPDTPSIRGFDIEDTLIIKP